MKVAYKKLTQLSLFGFNIFRLKTDYIERSSDKENDEDKTLFFRISDKTTENDGGVIEHVRIKKRRF